MFPRFLPVIVLMGSTLLLRSLPAHAIRPLAERRLAADSKVCKEVAALAHSVALARDAGVSLKRMFTDTILPVETPEVIRKQQNFYLEIYANPRLSPDDIKRQWELDCLRDRINARQP